jgi:hypothetical protein
MSAFPMMRPLSVGALRGDLRQPFVWRLELDRRSDSQTDMYVLETTVNPVLVA